VICVHSKHRSDGRLVEKRGIPHAPTGSGDAGHKGTGLKVELEVNDRGDPPTPGQRCKKLKAKELREEHPGSG